MGANYLVGDSIPIKVLVTDENGPVTPSTATCTVMRNPAGTIVVNAATMTISGNQLTYTLSATDTTVDGKYKFIVKATLSSGNIAQFVTFKDVKTP